MIVKLQSPPARRIAVFGFLFVVFGLTFWVISPFLASLAWAGVLAYATWPPYQRLRARLAGRDSLAALTMTLLVAAMLLLPLLWVMLHITADLTHAAQTLQQVKESGLPPLPPGIRDWPLVGNWIGQGYARLLSDPAWMREQLSQMGAQALPMLKRVAAGIGLNAAKFGLAVFALFFLYRHGDSLLAQIRQVAVLWLGGSARGYIGAIGVTVRAVVFGIVLTALAQGLAAGLGYWVAGVPAPALWGVVTAIVSLIPFVGPVVWIGLSFGLLVQGESGAALGLFLWGALVVSWIDNLIRPLVISGPTRIPFLLVLLGVLGGLSAFGLIGLFVGPVILGMALALWREWLEEQTHTDSA